METLDNKKMKTSEAVLVVLGILFISFNLRAPITAVGSIVEMIQTEYSLSNAVAGFITTIPLVVFAVVSPFVAKISAKLGHSLTMMFGLIFILIGEFVRSYAGVVGLFAGTAIIGIGIAIGNVIIPAIIKLHFSDKVGLITSIYTSGMCIFAAVGAGISIPLAKGMDLGWHHALSSWFILTILTICIWLPQVIKKKTPVATVNQQNNEPIKKSKSIWRSGLAWWVTMFMGIQSLIFYSLVAWLPTIIVSKGLSEDFSGTMALVFQLMAIPATLVIPILTGKFSNQKGLVLVTCIIYITGMLVFLFSTSVGGVATAVVLMAIGMGGSISLSIAFISLRSPNSKRASELSGMSQSAGYLLAAVGPTLAGAISEAEGGWISTLVLLIVLIAVLAFCGIFAGANKMVEE